MTFQEANELSDRQVEIVETIQRETFDGNTDFLGLLPANVSNIAQKANKEYENSGVSEESRALDNQLAQIVKTFWSESGEFIGK